MPSENLKTRRDEHEDDDLDLSGSVMRGYAYQRPAILVLLGERETHGYDLALRLADLGFDTPVASIYSVLRSMERAGLVTSSWDTSCNGGPPKRVYSVTDIGEAYLRRVTPALSRYRDALGAMLDRYAAGVVADGAGSAETLLPFVVEPDLNKVHGRV